MPQKIAKPKPEWSDLPTDLLGLILKKLDFFDIIRFRCVCYSWNMAVQSYIASPSYAPLQSPWLMRFDEDDGKANVCSFFSQEGNKVFQVNNVFGELGELDEGAWCFGSTKGWLVILDKTKILHLVNPLSGVKIQLPSAPKYDGHTYPSEPTSHYITKAVLLSDPTRSKDFTIVVCYRYIVRLTFCKFGDNKWTEFGDEITYFRNMICHSMNGQLFVIYGNLVVEVWDFQGPFPIKVKKHGSSIPLIYRHVNRNVDFEKVCAVCVRCYLVESMGEILVLIRIAHLYIDTGHYSTRQFVAYKVDYSRKIFVRVENLLERALFISQNKSISVSTTTLPQYKENSIYFTDDYFPGANGYDIGVYNLRQDKVINKIDMQPSNYSWCFWFVPN